MSKHTNHDGLYKKNESPIVESVRQTEGLYKRVKVAKVEVDSPNDDTLEKVKELENEAPNGKKILTE